MRFQKVRVGRENAKERNSSGEIESEKAKVSVSGEVSVSLDKCPCRKDDYRMDEPETCPAPLKDASKPCHASPAGACDCHIHIFDGPSPQVPGRSYTAPLAPMADYVRLQNTLGLHRAVIVQPSIYGTDNRTTLSAIPPDGSMKAVVVVDAMTNLQELIHRAGNAVVGARLNMLYASNAKALSVDDLAARLADHGLHLQILADVSTRPDLDVVLGNLPVPVVLDHMGHVPVKMGVDDPGFQALLRLLEQGHVWVKLSGAYRVAPQDFTLAEPMVQALVACNPERLVWGSDWPHPAVEGPMPDDGKLLGALIDWVGSKTAERILVQNPEHLYGFEPWEGLN